MSTKCTHCFDTSPTDRRLVCEECYEVFCGEHASPTQHHCTETRSVRIALGNGSVYKFPVDKKFDYRALAIPTNFLRNFLAPAIASDGTRTFLSIMWWWFFIQTVALFYLDASNPENSLWFAIFVLDSSHVEYVWTWLTSIFTHGGLLHLGLNSLVLAMFGPLAERVLGTRRFIFLFFGTALIAALAEVMVAIFVGTPAFLVGASGAISGIIGLVATTEPDTRVYFFGIVPMPLWVTAALVSFGSIAVVVLYGTGAFGIAHLAHAGGLFAGVAYGLTIDENRLRDHLQSLLR